MTDITELAQMKGQKVEGSYYLAECTDCGKMYPSNKLNGGEPLFSGDYGECYCPHCNADDAAIGDCGDTAAIAWNYQQGRIDALVEALEKAQAKNALVAGGIEAATKLHERIAELESRTVTVKLPPKDDVGAASTSAVTVKLPGWFVKDAIAVYDRDEVEEALTAAGIKWEAE
ncbi:TPA: hypothetical protein ACUE4H_003450 [Klebsiella quasipneumoniae]